MVSKMRRPTQGASATWGDCVLNTVSLREWAAPSVLALQTRRQSEEANQQPQVLTRVEAETKVSEDPGDRCLTSRALHPP